MKHWREVAVPRPDVLEGIFQQSEFAADITAVRTGQATREHQEAKGIAWNGQALCIMGLDQRNDLPRRPSMLPGRPSLFRVTER